MKNYITPLVCVGVIFYLFRKFIKIENYNNLKSHIIKKD
jgi:hypothetical protein